MTPPPPPAPPLPSPPSPPIESIEETAESGVPSGLANGAGSQLLFWVYSLAIFASAFLLFQVQPLIGKFILPWFGGTPSVWTTCMLVFQILLFGGYAYSHFTINWLTPKAQAVVHGALLTAACLALPIVPNIAWRPTGDEEPIGRIVIVLAATVGLPFFVLSTTGPLLQGWFSQTHRGRSPYRLYALSNAGSLLALISYPAVFEWSFAARALAHLWSWCFGAFALLCAACAIGAARLNRPTTAIAQPTIAIETTPAPRLGIRTLWFLLAMVPSVLLLATTNQVCLDVASVPFLWVLPLTLYLLSFILCFDSERWYSRRLMMPATAVTMACLYPVLCTGATVTFALQIVPYFTAFFLCAMVCHGELVRLKPDVRHLTSFYLLISAGGAAGGIFVGIAAPLIFKNYYELHWGLFACAALMLVVLFTDPESRFFRARARGWSLALLFALSSFGVALAEQARQLGQGVVDVQRTFYGVLRVTTDESEYGEKSEPILRLLNGRIAHGFEYQSAALREVPTTYYSPESGIGLLLEPKPQKHPRRVGLVGLGIGTLATYARPGDHFQFYEINPQVERLAREHFHYLADSRGLVEIIHGDARLTLERQPPQNFDVLALDAFSGDAIPVHLLTEEAFGIYLGHMAADGVIAVHISNRHFTLRPIVEAIADHYHLARAAINSKTTSYGGYSSTWVLVSTDPKALQTAPIREAALEDEKNRILWTDEQASLAQVLWLPSARGLWSEVRHSISEFRDKLFGPKKDGAPEGAP